MSPECNAVSVSFVPALIPCRNYPPPVCVHTCWRSSSSWPRVAPNCGLGTKRARLACKSAGRRPSCSTRSSTRCSSKRCRSQRHGARRTPQARCTRSAWRLRPRDVAPFSDVDLMILHTPDSSARVGRWPNAWCATCTMWGSCWGKACARSAMPASLPAPTPRSVRRSSSRGISPAMSNCSTLCRAVFAARHNAIASRCLRRSRKPGRGTHTVRRLSLPARTECQTVPRHAARYSTAALDRVCLLWSRRSGHAAFARTTHA